MDNIITTLIYPMLRKWLTGAAGAWIAILIEKGVLTQPQVDTVIQAVCAVALFAGAALWTWVKNKLAKQTAITVPTVAVPTVAAIAAGVAAANAELPKIK